MRAVSGVTEAVAIDATESGRGRRHAAASRPKRDVREALCRALVAADLGLLEVRRGERELESVFLELAGAEADSADGAASPKKKKAGRKGAKKRTTGAAEDTRAEAKAAAEEDGSEP